MGSTTFRAANMFMTAMFLFSVAVQYNDPDPIQWMAVYGAAAVACILSLRGKLDWRFAGIVAVAALIWAGIWAPAVFSRPFPTDIVSEFHMTSPSVEEAREFGGLMIVAVWMIILAVRSKRKPVHRPTHQPT